ncbi:epimerase/hydratase [Bombardia bombarda]|uniref:Epimerase/hydratase n=1 Tax=Bombardia bombarda TaxID=252184 RepID=A0AA39XNX2_9PEZI|nr:epimerase/hydratase [Bombardia bombarda]
MAVTTRPQIFLIFGNGWIASQIKELLEAAGKTVVVSLVRTESREEVTNELIRHNATNVFNCAGLRGTPNADWCEDHQVEVTRSNILGVLNVVDCCFELSIHVTQFGSGCIYDQDEAHPLDGTGFTEEETPFYGGSMYSRSRLLSENTIRVYPNVLILRLRGPMAADLNQKNLITRLMTYKKLISIPSSISVLTNLLPGAVLMAEYGVTGIYNLVNPQPCTNNQVMELAKKYIRPSLTWENFEVEDMNKVLKAPRANVTLDATKLVKKCRELGYEIKDSQTAVEDMFIEMRAKGL